MSTKSPPIDSFTDEYRFLSNFYTSPIKYNGLIYKSVEHAYQAAKASNSDDRKKIQSAKNPAEAKKLGKRIKLRPDWESIKLNVMLDCLRLKFEDKQLAKKLLDTGDADLIEGNTWGDTIWGVYKGRGQNLLGKLLMRVRTELANEL